MGLNLKFNSKAIAAHGRNPANAALTGLTTMLALWAAPAVAETHVTGDMAAGEISFAQQCVKCHVVVTDAGETLAGRNGRIGPNLFGIPGQTTGAVPGYRYTDFIIRAGQSGATWDEATFVAFVGNPTEWLRTTLNDPAARSRMNFEVRDPADAANIYAFLASLAAVAETEESAAAEEPAKVAVTGRPVSYDPDQAERGSTRYMNDCAECHGDDLKGGLNGGASLRSVSFLQKYAEGAPASDLFYYMSNAMPPSSPGRYSESNYADLMAFILRRNGFQAGAALPSDLDSLDHLIMEK
ncbi:c-type cytochrome [Marivita sp.]|uniref:c-type cytochrome n=1 Tax=Marivita sp. TaxID=2003365 RepID=UPI003F6E73A8